MYVHAALGRSKVKYQKKKRRKKDSLLCSPDPLIPSSTPRHVPYVVGFVHRYLTWWRMSAVIMMMGFDIYIFPMPPNIIQTCALCRYFEVKFIFSLLSVGIPTTPQSSIIMLAVVHWFFHVKSNTEHVNLSWKLIIHNQQAGSCLEIANQNMIFLNIFII